MKSLLIAVLLLSPVGAFAQKTCYSPSDCTGMEHCTSLDDGIVPGRCTTDARIINKKPVKPAPLPPVIKKSSSSKAAVSSKPSSSSSKMSSSSVKSSSSSSVVSSSASVSSMSAEQLSKLQESMNSMIQSMMSMFGSIKSSMDSMLGSVKCAFGGCK